MVRRPTPTPTPQQSRRYRAASTQVVGTRRSLANSRFVLLLWTRAELATRTTTVLGRGTELFEAYLIHDAPEVRLAASSFLHEFFGWDAEREAGEIPRQKKYAEKTRQVVAEHRARVRGEPIPEIPVDPIPEPAVLHTRRDTVNGMLKCATDSPQYAHMMQLLAESFA